MIATAERTRIEIVLDAPLARTAIEIIERAGVTGYTLFTASGGAGHGGRWNDDQVTRADSKVLLLTIATAEKAEAIVAALEPLLESHGIIIMRSSVRIVRPEKF